MKINTNLFNTKIAFDVNRFFVYEISMSSFDRRRVNERQKTAAALSGRNKSV